MRLRKIMNYFFTQKASISFNGSNFLIRIFWTVVSCHGCSIEIQVLNHGVVNISQYPEDFLLPQSVARLKTAAASHDFSTMEATIVMEALKYDEKIRPMRKLHVRSNHYFETRKRDSKETERFDTAKRNPQLLEMLTWVPPRIFNR